MEIKSYLNKLVSDGFFADEKFRFETPDSDKYFLLMAEQLKMKILPEYKNITDWMAKNDGSGLILFGSPGRGKSLIAQKIMPKFFEYYFGKIVNCIDSQQINDQLDYILSRKIVILDDIGIEEQRIVYGDRKWAFPEIMDNAEKKGNLVIITTNLLPQNIEQKYGIRTRERIRACCKAVLFKGESMRK